MKFLHSFGSSLLPFKTVLLSESLVSTGVGMALSRVWITDLEALINPDAVSETRRRTIEDSEQSWPDQPLHETKTAYERMRTNIRALEKEGALTNQGLPFVGVSGFPNDEGTQNIVNPRELDPNGILQLLWWGAPHNNPSSGSTFRHGSTATGHQHKSNAFESMKWLCPQGTLIITFPDKYDVEFWHPRADGMDSERVLICGRMHSRQYIPMTSGNGRRFKIPEADLENTMIALQVAPRHMNCIVWEDTKIDFGATVRRILGTFELGDFAVALGVYDCSLEMELLAVD